MKKSNLLKGAAAVALGLAAVGCSHEIGGGEADLRAQIIAEYNEMFIKTFGRPAADQDWGFGTSGTRSAVDPWNKTADTHDWEDGFTSLYKSEEDIRNTATDLTDPNLDQNLWFEGIGYIPSTYTKGDVVKCKVTAPATVYIYGTIEDLDMDVHGSGPVTFYNVGTITAFEPNAGSDHIIYNAGTMTVTKTSNIDKLYNKKELAFDRNKYEQKADLHSDMTIYSSAEGSIDVLCEADWKAACHIDHIVNAYGYLYIQNSTDKYMCGVVSVNEGDNIKIVDSAGGLTTSYIKTNQLTLNGASVYLTNNGYVNANQIHVEGSSCNSQLGSEYEAIVVEPVTGAKAFVETTSFDLPNVKVFGNHLGAGVYTKFETVRYYAEGYENTVVTQTAEDYFKRYPNEAGKLAPETLGGVSECGGEWGNKTTTTTPADEFVFQHRVFAEDLTASEDGSDLDFNDVVFDLYYNANLDQTQIVLQAAGGTLPLTVDGVEVHAAFNVPTTTMVNTGICPGATTVDKDSVVIRTLSGHKLPGDIVIKVTKAGTTEPMEITAYKGQPAAKFAVTKPIDWAGERKEFKNKYPLFAEWVKYPSVVWY